LQLRVKTKRPRSPQQSTEQTLRAGWGPVTGVGQARRPSALASRQRAPAAPCAAGARLEDEPRAARVDQRRLVSGGAVAPHRKLEGRVQVLEVRAPVAAALARIAAWRARAPRGGRCISE